MTNGTSKAAGGMCTVRSSVKATPCRTSIPSPSSARKRCTSVADAVFTERPNGRGCNAGGVRLARGAIGAGEEERLRRDLGLDRVRRDRGHAQQVGLRGRARARVDQVVELAAVAPPAAPVAPGRREAAAGELDPPVHDARVSQGHVRCLAPDVAVRGDVLEGPVVAGGDERVVHRRVEAAAGALARGERELDDTAEVGAGREGAGAVEARQLGVVPEAGEQRLQPVELALCSLECTRGAVGVDEELDLGAHRAERAALDHDVLVTVSGGRFTTRADGDAAGGL